MNVVWLQAGGCGGCSMALLGADSRDFTGMLASGTTEPMADWVRALTGQANYVLAIGSYSAFGGINAAGCPTHDAWVIETLMMITDGSLVADHLDALARPRLFADTLVHHGCPCNEFDEFKASGEAAAEQGCLTVNLGCMGTQAHSDCNERPWNSVGSCVRGGFPCIACTEPGFESPQHPFLETPKMVGIPLGLPSNMPKAWFVALAALSKSATPKRVRENSRADRGVLLPAVKRRK